MKTIICPTDFSKNADKALDFAINIAERSKAKLIVLNAYDLPYSQNVMSTSLLEIMKETSERGLEELKENLSKHNIEVETYSRMGNPIRVIKDFTENYDESIVVMGTKGASGLEEVLIGSNAASTLHMVNVPVLTIPTTSEISEIKTIIYAADYESKKDEQGLSRLATLAKVYDAQVKILHVTDPKKNQVADKAKFDKTFEGINISYHEVEGTDSVETDIINFANQENANMICLMARRYGFVEGLFHTSKTSKVAYKTNRPFLALHETK